MHKAQWDHSSIPNEFSKIPVRVDSDDYPNVFRLWSKKMAYNTKLSSDLNTAVLEVIASVICNNNQSTVSIVRIGENQVACEHTDTDDQTTVV